MPHGIIFLKSENCGLADGYVLNENHSDIQNGQLFHLPTTNRERLPHNAAGILIKDSETRFWLAKMVAGHKGNGDVAPIFETAEKLAGKIPREVGIGRGRQLRPRPQKAVRGQELPPQGLRARQTHPHGRRHEQQPDGVVQRQYSKAPREGSMRAQDGRLGDPGWPSGSTTTTSARTLDCRTARPQARRLASESRGTTSGRPSFRWRQSRSPTTESQLPLFFLTSSPSTWSPVRTLGMKNILVWKNRDC